MDKYLSFFIVALVILAIAALAIAGFWLASRWSEMAGNAYDAHPEINRVGIGGFLWFPAIWSLTDLIISFVMIGANKKLGLFLLFLSLLNLIFFWSRAWFYPHFFLAKNIIAIAVMVLIYGVGSLGMGLLISAIFAAYLYVSDRSKRTFIHRLNGALKVTQ